MAESYAVQVRTIREHEEVPEGCEIPTIFIPNGRFGPLEINMSNLSGAHVLHLAVAVCVFNDLFREAQQRGITLDSVLVSADGTFNENFTRSNGINYQIELVSSSPETDLHELIARVKQIAEVPMMLRQGIQINLTDSSVFKKVITQPE